MGGLGERFKNNGYSRPKPLIHIHGKEMILYVINSLHLQPDDKLIIIYNKELDNYNFQQIIKRENIEYCVLSCQTRGAAETIYALKDVRTIDFKRKTILCDCDTFYSYDIIKAYRSMMDHAIVCFEEKRDILLYSYIALNDQGNVSEIKEKQKISNYANTGCYCFKSLNSIIEACKKVIEEKIMFNNEFYISCIIDTMLRDGHVFKPIILSESDIHCVGTPNQLKMFSLLNRSNERLRFCFDIDNTLVIMDGQYTKGILIEKNVNFLKMLKQQGHTIILYTARRMKTHDGNVGKVIADVGTKTIQFLEKNNIPFDEIYFGKPYADFYIDDKAINAYNDLEKEIGVYQNNIKERSINNIEHTEIPVIIKKGEKTKISGEIYYYTSIPNDLKNLFPVMFKHTTDSYTLEKIHGINMSFLYIKEHMTLDIFESIFTALRRIHSHKPQSQDHDVLKRQMYDHYKKRLTDRKTNHIYDILPDSSRVYEILSSFFELYETHDIGCVTMIHGDPVFSNIIMEKQSNIKFIDMRGILLNELTIYGDPRYDVAKIMQCLMGYDEIMHDISLSSKYKYLLFEAIEKHINDMAMDISIIKMITYSHIYTLLPLHDCEKAIKYYSLINVNVLEALLEDISKKLASQKNNADHAY
jgi:capsule biosynthesis phosphatase